MAKEEGFGARLKTARTKAGLTQKELARRAGYDQVSLSRVENGDIVPRFDTVMKIAKVLGLDAAALYELAAEKATAANSPAPSATSEPVEATTPFAEGGETAQLWKAIALLQQSVSGLASAQLERATIAAEVVDRLGRMENRLARLENAEVSKKQPQRRAAGK